MSYPEAKEIVLRLVKISDLVMENFSPRVMSNWGLDYERLKEVKPDLIMLSMSAMGQKGPWKDNVAYGPTLQALSGLTYLTSYVKESPMGIGYAYADPISGLYASVAALSALEYRDRTGKGLYIDLSECEAVCSLMGPTLMDSALNHRDILPQGNRSPDLPAAPYGCYRCSGIDRWCVIAVYDETEWESFCRVLGHPDWTKEQRFSTLSKRKENEEELNKLIEQWTLRRPPEEVVEALQKEGISAGVVQDAKDLANDPHLISREFFISLDHPVLGKTISDTSPIRFEEGPRDRWKAAPLLGQDNDYVYKELLGFTDDEFSSYVERGIVG
jgi:crotonobetainyl-CoA:carnitine CoA-transferase CaiB-like acyl-CoA transferase